ncbi:MAG TPA: GtrA family protein [Actinocrinis sp.]|nr:GtrA family protein [Actinocrinis sp.]
MMHELAKYGTVGLTALAVNIVTTNLAWHAMPNAELTDSVIGTAVGTVVAYLGNRFWTYRECDSISRSREFLLFIVINAIGLLIETIPLTVTSYLLHLDGAFAGNVAKFGIGTSLGFFFRLWTYRTWVFPQSAPALAKVA